MNVRKCFISQMYKNIKLQLYIPPTKLDRIDFGPWHQRLLVYYKLDVLGYVSCTSCRYRSILNHGIFNTDEPKTN